MAFFSQFWFQSDGNFIHQAFHSEKINGRQNALVGRSSTLASMVSMVQEERMLLCSISLWREILVLQRPDSGLVGILYCKPFTAGAFDFPTSARSWLNIRRSFGTI